MTTTEQPADIDMDKLMGFLFQAAGDIGATLNTAWSSWATGSAFTGRWPAPAR